MIDFLLCDKLSLSSFFPWPQVPLRVYPNFCGIQNEEKTQTIHIGVFHESTMCTLKLQSSVWHLCHHTKLMCFLANVCGVICWKTCWQPRSFNHAGPPSFSVDTERIMDNNQYLRTTLQAERTISFISVRHIFQLQPHSMYLRSSATSRWRGEDKVQRFFFLMMQPYVRVDHILDIMDM